jgi:hypothetical protein
MLLYIALLTSAALAQPQQGTLSGTLFGVSGKGNAVLIFTNQSNGAVQRVTPNVNGGFTVSLPPGTYKVEVEREGFRQTARQNIEVTGGASSQVNVTIEGGPQIEAVEIKAEALFSTGITRS